MGNLWWFSAVDSKAGWGSGLEVPPLTSVETYWQMVGARGTLPEHPHNLPVVRTSLAVILGWTIDGSEARTSVVESHGAQAKMSKTES